MYVIFLPNRNQKLFKRIASVAEFSWKYFFKKSFEETLYAAIIAFYACIFFSIFPGGKQQWQSSLLKKIRQNSVWTAHFSWA